MSQFNLSRVSHWGAVEPVAASGKHASNRITRITASTESSESTGSPYPQRLNCITSPLAQALAHGILKLRTPWAAAVSRRPGIAYQTLSGQKYTWNWCVVSAPVELMLLSPGNAQ
jgi:hypothetical protein